VIWGSAAEFFAMGGYGFYVWGSFAVTAACLLAEPLLVRARGRRALEEAKMQARTQGSGQA
jgi:heme exporter protein D